MKPCVSGSCLRSLPVALGALLSPTPHPPAGQKAAIQGAKDGLRVLIVDQGRAPGGSRSQPHNAPPHGTS